jgi:hypothetical protein
VSWEVDHAAQLASDRSIQPRPTEGMITMASPETPRVTSPCTRRRTRRASRAITLGAGPLAASFTAMLAHPVLGMIVMIADLIVGITLLGFIVYGTHEQVDRVFRFLRWLRDRPEPPTPGN